MPELMEVAFSGYEAAKLGRRKVGALGRGGN